MGSITVASDYQEVIARGIDRPDAALAVSTMRAPIFRSFSRRVTNSATASGWVLGIASRSSSISQ